MEIGFGQVENNANRLDGLCSDSLEQFGREQMARKSFPMSSCRPAVSNSPSQSPADIQDRPQPFPDGEHTPDVGNARMKVAPTNEDSNIARPPALTIEPISMVV